MGLGEDWNVQPVLGNPNQYGGNLPVLGEPHLYWEGCTGTGRTGGSILGLGGVVLGLGGSDLYWEGHSGTGGSILVPGRLYWDWRIHTGTRRVILGLGRLGDPGESYWD